MPLPIEARLDRMRAEHEACDDANRRGSYRSQARIACKQASIDPPAWAAVRAPKPPRPAHRDREAVPRAPSKKEVDAEIAALQRADAIAEERRWRVAACLDRIRMSRRTASTCGVSFSV